MLMFRANLRQIIKREARMRQLFVVFVLLHFTISAASAQLAAQSADPDLLSAEQKVTIGTLITQKTTPLTNVQFSPVIGQVVPPQIVIQTLPSGTEQLAPQLRGYGCVVFEELIAIVDQNTRKIVLVIPRWQQQQKQS
jgi:Protein of unknown function (DUF1236)